MKNRTFIWLCTALSLFGAHAASAAGPILPAPTRVSEHLYAWIGPYGGPNQENQGFRMNLGFVVGKDAVAVIETGYYEPMVREMLAHIAKITKAPVKYVINSNSQPDRFLGNEYFRRQGATIITTAAEAKRMAERAVMLAQVNESLLGVKPGSIEIPGPPDRILEGNTELDLGGVKIKLMQFGASHTPGPFVVHVPKDNVVYGGDILYSGRLPAVIDGGNVKSWIKTYDALKQFGNATFVPGHGEPAKLSAFEFSTRQYLVMLHDHMAKAVEQGKDQLDAMSSLDQSRFSKLENYEELYKRNASFAYLEAEAAAFK